MKKNTPELPKHLSSHCDSEEFATNVDIPSDLILQNSIDEVASHFLPMVRIVFAFSCAVLLITALLMVLYTMTRISSFWELQ